MSEAEAAVRWLLDQSEPEARRIAVQQIPKVPARECVDLLLRALADDDWRVRKEAAQLAPTLERREEIVAALVAGFEESVNIGLRNAVVEALICIGSDAVGVVLEVLPRLGADARKLAVEVLGATGDPRGVAALLLSLDDDDLNVRVAAAEALGGAALAGDQARERATDALTQALAASRDTFLRIALLEALSRLEVRLPWAVVQPYVDDPILRRHALAIAAGSPEPGAVLALATASGDPSSTIAREAVIALGALLGGSPTESQLELVGDAVRRTSHGQITVRRLARDPDDSPGRAGALILLGLLRQASDVPLLARALGDDDVAERAEAGLRLFGPGVVGSLLEATRTERSTVRAAALILACSLEGAPLDDVRLAVREALHASTADVVSCALDALGTMGDGSDLHDVVALMTHADARIAATATNAVAKLAARQPQAAREVLRSLSADRSSGALACVLLGAIASSGNPTESDIRQLMTALADADPEVRSAAVNALAQAGRHAATDAIVFALADEAQSVKLAAVQALGRLGRAESLLNVIADTRDPSLAAAALLALSETDPDKAFSAARPLTRHPDPAIACVAVEAIGVLCRSGRDLATSRDAQEDALFSALEHPHYDVVKLALSLLGNRAGPRAFTRLGLCLDHASWDVRRLAAELLGQADDSAAEALLRSRYGRETDPSVREAIAQAVSLRPKAETLTSARPPEAVRVTRSGRQ